MSDNKLPSSSSGPNADNTTSPKIREEDENKNEKNDIAKFSSAAQCITLKLLGCKFGVEYTHQCFDGEFIPGYQPYRYKYSDSSSSSIKKYHSSHKLLTTHELEIEIELSPSCTGCCVQFSIRRKDEKENKDGGAKDVDVDDERQKKRPRKGNDKEEEEEQKELSLDRIASETCTRMLPNEIQERLTRALPKVLSNEEFFHNSDYYLRKPIGKILKTYTRTSSGFSNNENNNNKKEEEEEHFVMTIANEDEASNYHNSIQNIALFFIESAENVDFTQTEYGGYWKVMYLFQRHKQSNNDGKEEEHQYHYSLCGYMTLFHFHALFRKPKPGIIIRICQALLLPPYQRKGHGKAMFHELHKIAKQIQNTNEKNENNNSNNNNTEIVEINVEDPAPAFTALRNRVDYELLMKSIEQGSPWFNNEEYLKPDIFPLLKESDAIRAASFGRITPHQVKIAYELYKLKHLTTSEEEGNDTNTNNTSSIETQYRLMVKKRLLKLHHETLSQYQTKEERKRKLDEIWLQVYDTYKAILKK